MSPCRVPPRDGGCAKPARESHSQQQQQRGGGARQAGGEGGGAAGDEIIRGHGRALRPVGVLEIWYVYPLVPRNSRRRVLGLSALNTLKPPPKRQKTSKNATYDKDSSSGTHNVMLPEGNSQNDKRIDGRPSSDAIHFNFEGIRRLRTGQPSPEGLSGVRKP